MKGDLLFIIIVISSSLSLGKFYRGLQLDQGEVIVKAQGLVRGVDDDLRHVPGHLPHIQVTIVILIVEVTQQYQELVLVLPELKKQAIIPLIPS